MIELVQVDADDVRLDRLLQLYMHEWSALVATPIGADARYTYDELPDYADRERHAAYLFVEGEAAVGFGLVARDPDGCWHVEELFVVAGWRRRGAGAEAVRRLFAAWPGPWTWTVRPENPGALGFWRRAVPDATETIELGTDAIARTRMRVVAT